MPAFTGACGLRRIQSKEILGRVRHHRPAAGTHSLYIYIYTHTLYNYTYIHVCVCVCVCVCVSVCVCVCMYIWDYTVYIYICIITRTHTFQALTVENFLPFTLSRPFLLFSPLFNPRLSFRSSRTGQRGRRSTTTAMEACAPTSVPHCLSSSTIAQVFSLFFCPSFFLFFYYQSQRQRRPLYQLQCHTFFRGAQ